MRRSFGLFELIVSPRNVWEASLDARRGKRRRPDVTAFSLVEEEEVTRLVDQLSAGSWRPAAYRSKVIAEPKRRLIAAAPFRDRVVHHAIHRVLAPVLERGFIDQSFACRRGLGTHRAVLSFQRGLRDGRWLARLDIRRYYLEIQWDTLIDIIRRKVRPDRRLFELLEIVLASGHGLYSDPNVLAALGLVDSYRPEPRKGLPIGNLTSQLFGNLYLDGFDHFVKRELRAPIYLRYMDDMALIGPRRGETRCWAEAAREWLADHRQLEARIVGSEPRSTRGAFTFLGMTVTGSSRRVCGATVKRMRARVRRAARQKLSDAEVDKIGNDLASSISSLVL